MLIKTKHPQLAILDVYIKTTQQKYSHLHICKGSTTVMQTSKEHPSLNDRDELFIPYPRCITTVASVNHRWRLDSTEISVTLWTNTLYNISHWALPRASWSKGHLFVLFLVTTKSTKDNFSILTFMTPLDMILAKNTYNKLP